VINRLSETREASLPESQAENASPNGDQRSRHHFQSRARCSQFLCGMMGPNVRSAMFTKKRIISAVKYSGRFQNWVAEGAGDTLLISKWFGLLRAMTSVSNRTSCRVRRIIR